MRYIFDIEANNLLPHVNKVFCAVTYNLDTGEYQEFPPERLPEFLSLIQNATLLIGHNILGYDLPVLQLLQNLQ